LGQPELDSGSHNLLIENLYLDKKKIGKFLKNLFA